VTDNLATLVEAGGLRLLRGRALAVLCARIWLRSRGQRPTNRAVAQLTGMTARTVYKGVRDLKLVGIDPDSAKLDRVSIGAGPLAAVPPPRR
jgi:hypothetical protein